MSVTQPPAAPRPTSVSTHILDTSAGRPAEGVAVQTSVRAGPGGDWTAHGASTTDADGRCKDLPDLPEGATHVRLRFEVEPYFARRADQNADGHAEDKQDAPRPGAGAPDAGNSGPFFPEVVITFTVNPGEHYHVPLLLNPFGYSVYRGS